MVPELTIRLRWEPGSNPRLPRSGMCKRNRLCTGYAWEATNSGWAETKLPEFTSPKTCSWPKGFAPFDPTWNFCGEGPGCLPARLPRQFSAALVPCAVPVRPRGRGSTLAAFAARIRSSVMARVAFAPLCDSQEEIQMFLVTRSNVTGQGFPRMGQKRELKTAREKFCKGESGADDLQSTDRTLRERHWQLQQTAGADIVPGNDVTLCVDVLDTAWLFGAVPAAYRELAQTDPFAAYFASARGLQSGSLDLRALEMTTWFDTHYHDLVPALTRDQPLALHGDKPIAEFLQARARGYNARPILLGSVSFLLLSETTDGSDRFASLPQLLAA